MKTTKNNKKTKGQKLKKKHKIKINKVIGPLKNDVGEFVIDPKEQAETMSQFFSSVFTRSDGELPTKTAFNGNSELSDIEVTE